MSSILNSRFSGGYVSTGTGGRDASDLASGELQKMTGGYYRKDDPYQVWKMPGRALFGSAGSSGVKGIAVCQFDDGGTDLLLASIGTSIYSATPGSSGSLSSLVSGLSSDATTFVAAHQEDRWYLCNGYDQNRVLLSDGTTRLMGMNPPDTAPTAQPALVLGSVANRPTINTSAAGGGFRNPTLAYDGDESTYSSAVTPADSHPSDSNHNIYGHTWSGFSADSTAGRKLRILCSGLLGPALNNFGSIKVYWSDDGVTSSLLLWLKGGAANKTLDKGWLETAITVDSSLIQVTVFIESPYLGTELDVFDIRIERGSDLATTTTTGVYYATTEYSDVEDIESPPSKFSGLIQLTSQGQVVVTRGNIVNPAATHWLVYRVGDGVPKTYDNLGLVSGKIKISDTTWTDTLEVAVTEQATPIVPLVTVGDQLYFRDSPPLPFISMTSWKGSICGISLGSPRSWYYSQAGRPDSFPTIYRVESFPLDENDGLVGQMAVGETMVLLCGGAVLALDDIPRVTDGQFNAVDARPLKGHPGCVGVYSYATYSVAGEPRGAWVSPYGVYVTNGAICACISTDLAWEREVNVPYLSSSVLKWDAKNLILWFEFDLDGDGKNDREMPFHMAQAHAKGEEMHKLGQPTAKASSCMATALVASAYFRYSGDPAVGKVYVEESGTVDAATGSEVVMTVKSAQLSHDKVDLAVVKATLAHSDFGSGQTGTLIVTAYRDVSNSESSRSQSIRLDGNRGTTAGVGRAGELIDVEVSYSGTAIGGLGGVALEIDGQGRSGSAPRVSSNSATP